MSVLAHPRTELSRLVQTLAAAPSARGRMLVADKVGLVFAQHRLSDEERALAHAICEACANDLEVVVRTALSRQLCRSPLLSPELARRMADDVATVAGPVLAYSTVLSDDDLLAIIETANQEKLLAIAGRMAVSTGVGDALVKYGDAQVVSTVLANPAAALTEPILVHALDRFPNNDDIHAALVDRPRLPAAVTARLVTLISEALASRLVAREDFAPELALGICRKASDAALVGISDQHTADIVDALFAQDKLTPMLLLRGLVMRQRAFVMLAIARLAGQPVAEVEVQLHNGGSFKARKIYQRARLPATLYSAFNAALSALRDADVSDPAPDQVAFESDLLERLAVAYPAIDTGELEQALDDIAKTVPSIEQAMSRRRALH